MGALAQYGLHYMGAVTPSGAGWSFKAVLTVNCVLYDTYWLYLLYNVTVYTSLT